MGLISRAIAATAKGGWKATLGNNVGRMGVGAVAGGVYGGVTSDSNLGENTFGSVMAGAFVGAGIGALPSVGKWAFSSKGLQGLNKAAVGVGYPALKGAKNLGQGVMNFAFNNPRATIGMAAGGLGLYGLASTGHGSTNASADAMNEMAMQRGTNSALSGPQMDYLKGSPSYMPPRYRELQESTAGLVQGLHHGRHR